MLDIKFIRENTDLVRKAVRDKNSSVDLDQLLRVDEKRRVLTTQVEALRQQRNEAAASKDVERGRSIKGELGKLEADLVVVSKDYFELMIQVPNIPLADVPIGKDDSENVVVRKWGEPKKFDFEVKDHFELGKALDLIDTETAAAVTGSRFTYLKNQAVGLQFALIQYAFSILQDQAILKEIAEKVAPGFSSKVFTPVVPPVMIRPEVYTKMARLDPEQAEERYYLQKDDIYLIGSAEHTLGPMHMDQILDEEGLPIRYVGYSTSFRREAGSYGRDVKGILRMHQFDKVEMESFCLPENSAQEQEFFVAIQEHLMQMLKIPYQIVNVCTGDMGGPDARHFDVECWVPAQKKYRETHSADLVTDYQARRLGTKCRRKDGKVEFIHMNDATVFAIGRTLIAIMENYQRMDGSIEVPEVLVPYTGFTEITPKN